MLLCQCSCLLFEAVYLKRLKPISFIISIQSNRLFVTVKYGNSALGNVGTGYPLWNDYDSISHICSYD